MSTLMAAWRVVTKRAAADWLMLTAALITIVLATTLLAAGPIYSNAVTLSALQRTLEGTPADEANVEISVPVKPDRAPLADAVTRPEIARTFAVVDHEVYESAISEPYNLPVRTDGDVVDIAVFQYLEGIEEHATMSSGSWPEPSLGIPETAVSDRIVAELDLSVGDQIQMTTRRPPSEERTVEIVGIYTVTDVTDPFWFNDRLAIQGVTSSEFFKTYGPFVVDRETLLTDLIRVNTRLRYRVYPDHDSITADDLPSLIGSLPGLEDRLNSAMANSTTTGVLDYQDFSVSTTLRSVLLEAERSLSVTRSGVLMLSLQLSILAGLALIFTAGLLVESRRSETDLLRSRGATSRQVLVVALVEGALLTVPAALAAPRLATAALSLLNHVGPLASIGLVLDPRPTRSAYALAFLAATGCTVALATPAYRSARSFGESYVARGRQRSKSKVQGAGLDIALLTLATLGFWQLSVHGPTITTATRGRFGVDPLLIAGPAVGLVAGAVLALRTIPLLARASDAIAGKSRSTVQALSAWQISRRPVRYARSALLLIMAISIGLFAATYTATWTRSQNDQAAFEVGADIRVFPDRRINSSMPDLYLPNAFLEIESLQSSMPLVRKSGGGSATSTIRRFIILDAADAGNTVLIRDDLGPEFSEAMKVMVDRRPTLATSPLPGDPRRIAVTFGVEVEPLPEDNVEPSNPQSIAFHEANGLTALEVEGDASICFCPSVRAVVQDADGLLHRVDLGPLAVDSGLQRLETDLTLGLPDGTEVTPRYPLSLVDIEIRSPTPLDIIRDATITFAGVSVSQEAIGDSWTSTTPDLDRGTWDLTVTEVASAFRQASVSPAGDNGATLMFRVSTGRLTGQFPLPAYFSVRPTGTAITDPFPIVTTDRLLDEAGMEVGDDTRLRGLRVAHDSAEIVATIADFPTVDPARGEAVLIDLPTFQMVNYESGRQIETADEFWMSSGGEATAPVSAALRGPPYDSFAVLDGAEVADLMKTDPIALGTIGSLALGFVAAAVFAVVGFAVSATVSVRDRLTEFALLRALGLSNRQLGSWLILEQAALVALGLGLGTLIGLLLSWVALPLISVTQSGAAPVPELVLVYPWGTVFLLELAVFGSLAVTVSLLLGLLRRIGLGSLLRLGVD